jgi:hypothetical protein
MIPWTASSPNKDLSANAFEYSSCDVIRVNNQMDDDLYPVPQTSSNSRAAPSHKLWGGGVHFITQICVDIMYDDESFKPSRKYIFGLCHRIGLHKAPALLQDEDVEGGTTHHHTITPKTKRQTTQSPLQSRKAQDP